MIPMTTEATGFETYPTSFAHLSAAAKRFGLAVIEAGDWRYVVRVVPGLADGGPGVLIYQARVDS